MTHALRALNTTRFEHYDYTYQDESTSMSWLGNGLDEEELKPDGHLTGFLDPCVLCFSALNLAHAFAATLKPMRPHR